MFPRSFFSGRFYIPSYTLCPHGNIGQRTPNTIPDWVYFFKNKERYGIKPQNQKRNNVRYVAKR
jgi:hypothetical protein